MRVMLSSNLPCPGNEAIAARLQLEGVERIHWLAGSPDEQRYQSACAEFAAHDFFDVQAVAAGTLDVGGLSAGVDNDMWCLADGAAVWQDANGSPSVIGDARCLRRGEFAS